MKRTYFERNFLELNRYDDKPKKDYDNFDPNVVVFFHGLLERVNKKTIKRWTHDSLRNFVDAFYSKSEKSLAEKGGSLNVYDDGKELKIFFTGLYSEEGQRLFIILDKTKNGFWKQRIVLSDDRLDDNYKEKLKETVFQDHFESDNIEHVEKSDLQKMCDSLDLYSSSFVSGKEKEVLEERKRRLEIMDFSDFDFLLHYKGVNTKILETVNKENPDLRKNYNAQYKEENIQLRGWLHIFVDGVDNLPVDFIRSMFDLRRCDDLDDYYFQQKIVIDEALKEKNTKFICYCQILLMAIKAALEEVEESNFLMSFYKKIQRKPVQEKVKYINNSKDNYLLPICLMCASTPDFCIVIGQNNRKWEFKTLLNMDEVYTDMRVYGEKFVLDMQRKWKLWPDGYFDMDMVGDNTVANETVK